MDKLDLLDAPRFEELIKALLQGTTGITVTREIEFGFELEVSGSDLKLSLSLDNMYEAYRAEPHQLAEIVAGYIESIRQTAEMSDTSYVEHRLFPCIVRACDWMGDRIDLVRSDWIQDLEVSIVEDFTHSLRFVTNTSLSRWGISKEIAEAVAFENLEKSTEELWEEAKRQAQETGAFVFAGDDSHNAARILLPDFARRACEALGCSEVAVIVPVRDFLMAVPAGDQARMESLRNTAAHYYQEGPYSLAPNVFIITKPASS